MSVLVALIVTRIGVVHYCSQKGKLLQVSALCHWKQPMSDSFYITVHDLFQEAFCVTSMGLSGETRLCHLFVPADGFRRGLIHFYIHSITQTKHSLFFIKMLNLKRVAFQSDKYQLLQLLLLSLYGKSFTKLDKNIFYIEN